jgi:hypothetical protein
MDALMRYVQDSLVRAQDELVQFVEDGLWLSKSDQENVYAIREELAGALNYEPGIGWAEKFNAIFAERFAHLADWHLDD